MPEKIALSWSSGKDAALALYRLQKAGYSVAQLLTTISADTFRVTTHGVRKTLLQQQAQSIGIPVLEISLPAATSHDAYEQAMLAACKQL